MKLAICTFSSAVAIANAQLAIPGRLRSSASSNEWGRQKGRSQTVRSLESSMSFSMPEIDASISMPETEASMSMGVDMDWAVPEEPEIILDEVPVVIVETTEKEIETDGTPEDNAEIKEDFIDGEFEEMKLEANAATLSSMNFAIASTLVYAFINMI